MAGALSRVRCPSRACAKGFRGDSYGHAYFVPVKSGGDPRAAKQVWGRVGLTLRTHTRLHDHCNDLEITRLHLAALLRARGDGTGGCSHIRFTPTLFHTSKIHTFFIRKAVISHQQLPLRDYLRNSHKLYSKLYENISHNLRYCTTFGTQTCQKCIPNLHS